MKGFGDRAIFKAVVREWLVPQNTPVTKVIHFTARQAKHRVLNGELFFKVIQVKIWSNWTSPILQRQNKRLVFTVFKKSVSAILNALLNDGVYIAVSDNIL